MESKNTSSVQTKVCNKCGEEKLVSEFNKNSGTKDKLCGHCRECHSKERKRYTESGVIIENDIRDFVMDSREWQVGKPMGGYTRVPRRSVGECFLAKIVIKGKSASKRFSFDVFPRTEFPPEEKALHDAKKWLISISDSRKVTKNQIRRVDKDTIEVKLGHDKTMLTDIQFLDLCQKHVITYANGYAILSTGSKRYKFHKYITKNDITDHINRDGLDNRLVNLRDTDDFDNANNRRKLTKKTLTGITGVTFIESSNSYVAHLKRDCITYQKGFSRAKYGEHEALELAIAHRVKLCEEYGNTNGVPIDESLIHPIRLGIETYDF
jgi:hypothetical protein